jgi:hypothetical protein
LNRRRVSNLRKGTGLLAAGSQMKTTKLTVALFVVALCGVLAPRASQAQANQASVLSSFGVFRCGSETTEITGRSDSHNAIRLSLAMADFTGDNHPDVATVSVGPFDASDAQYFIDVRLTEGGRQSIGLRAPPGGLFITPIDVTGDGTLDLVVRATASHAIVAVFVNDGCGRFSRLGLDAAAHAFNANAPVVELAQTGSWFVGTALAQSPHELLAGDISRRRPRGQRTQFLSESRSSVHGGSLSSCASRAPPSVA